MATKETVHFSITTDNDDLKRKLAESRQALLNSGKTAEEQGIKIDGMYKRMASGADNAFSARQALQFAKQIAAVRGEFQTLEISFSTLLQSKKKANTLMTQMVELATKTPFTLTDIASGANQLITYGVASEDVVDTLTRLSNIAMGLSLPMERLTYLYGTAISQSGLYSQDLMQFTTSGIPMLQGLADVFGVSTGEVNKMVEAGRVGFPEVQKVIENLTDEGGQFNGLMNEMSKTVSDEISNLRDVIDAMFSEMGLSQEEVFGTAIDGAKYLAENYEPLLRILNSLDVAYGTYKAALIAITAYQKALSLIEATKGFLQMTTSVGGASHAMTLLNKVMGANPILKIISLLIAAGTALYSFYKNSNDAEKAQRQLNGAINEMHSSITIENLKIDDLFSKLKNAKKGTEEYEGAKKSILDQYGDYLSGMDEEITSLNNVELAYNRIKTAAKESIIERIKTEQLGKIEETAAEGFSNAIDKLQKGLGNAFSKKNKKYGDNLLPVIREALDAQNTTVLPDDKAARNRVIQAIEKEGYSSEGVSNIYNRISGAIEDYLKVSSHWKTQVKDIETKFGKPEKKNNGKIEPEFNESTKEKGEKTKNISNGLVGSMSDEKRDTNKTEHDFNNAALKLKEKKLDAERALERSYITDHIELIKFDRDTELKAIEDKKRAYIEKGKLTGKKEENIDTSSFVAQENLIKNNANDAILNEYKTSLETMLSEYQDYFAKMKSIEDKYANDENFLKKRNAESGGNDETILSALEVLNEKKNAELDELNIFYASKEASFLTFCDSLAKFSVDQLKEKLAEAESELNKLGNTKDEKAVTRAKGEIVKYKQEINKRDSKESGAPEKGEIKQWQNLQKTLKGVAGSFEEIGKEIGGVAGESISAAGQLAGNIVSMVDNILTFATTGIQGVQSAGGTAEKAIKSVEAASVILAVISAAIQIAMKIAELFSKDRELSEETIQSYETYMKVTDELIKQKKELIETVSGAQAVMEGDKALDVINKQVEATRQLGKEYLASAAKKSHTYGKKTWEKLSDNRADFESIGIDFNQLKGSGRAEGLFDLSIQQLKDFKYELPLVWAELDDDTHKYLERIIEGEDKVKEITEAVGNSMTGMSLDDARSELLDFLNDTDATMEDVANNFESHMANAVNRIIADGMNNELLAWYENFKKAMEDDTLTPAEKEDLKKGYEDIYVNSKKEQEALGVIGINAEKQTATSSGFETMSQETGSELNGRFTSMNNNIIITKDIIIQLNETATRMVERIGNGCDSLVDIRGLFTIAVEHLSAIEKNTFHLEAMKADLNQVKLNTSRL